MPGSAGLQYRTAILVRKRLFYIQNILRPYHEVEEMQKTIERREVQEETTAEVRELVHVMLNADTYASLQAISTLGAIGAPAVGPLVEIGRASCRERALVTV